MRRLFKFSRSASVFWDQGDLINVSIILIYVKKLCILQRIYWPLSLKIALSLLSRSVANVEFLDNSWEWTFQDHFPTYRSVTFTMIFHSLSHVTLNVPPSFRKRQHLPLGWSCSPMPTRWGAQIPKNSQGLVLVDTPCYSPSATHTTVPPNNRSPDWTRAVRKSVGYAAFPISLWYPCLIRCWHAVYSLLGYVAVLDFPLSHALYVHTLSFRVVPCAW